MLAVTLEQSTQRVGITGGSKVRWGVTLSTGRDLQGRRHEGGDTSGVALVVSPPPSPPMFRRCPSLWTHPQVLIPTPMSPSLPLSTHILVPTQSPCPHVHP